MADLRLGDIIDDYCSRCKNVTDHSVAALVDHEVRKVQCRSCHTDHEFRHGTPPPKKRKPTAFEQVLQGMNPAGATPPAPEPAKAKRGRVRK